MHSESNGELGTETDSANVSPKDGPGSGFTGEQNFAVAPDFRSKYRL
jgi:hypothetical protein